MLSRQYLHVDLHVYLHGCLSHIQETSQAWSSWFWLCTCFARLSRYKVLLLKPHLRDMLALARRRRAIQLYSIIRRFFMVFLQDQMFDICKWCHARILHMRLHGMIWTVIHCDSTDKDEIDWDWQDVKEPSPSQSRHKASRKGRDLRALWDWNDEVNEGIFGYVWQQLDLYSQ